jgi:hypothetical protein
VSRCQGVMFYLKENNLRYWSVGVCLLFFTSSARMHSSDQTHVNIIFLFLYITVYLKNVQMMYCHALLISLKQMYIYHFLSFSLTFIQYFIGKMDFIIIYSSLAQMSLYHFLFSFSKRGKKTEKAYFFLLP